MAQKIIKTLFCVGITAMALSCHKSVDDGQITGKYIDEFGNKFELREDHTATIQFNGQDKVNVTRWYDGDHNDTSYVTIGYNGDSAYYYMSHGKLFRNYDDMKNGQTAIVLEHDN